LSPNVASPEGSFEPENMNNAPSAATAATAINTPISKFPLFIIRLNLKNVKKVWYF